MVMWLRFILDPVYYGSYVFIWTALPAILFMVAVLVAQPFLFPVDH